MTVAQRALTPAEMAANELNLFELRNAAMIISVLSIVMSGMLTKEDQNQKKAATKANNAANPEAANLICSFLYGVPGIAWPTPSLTRAIDNILDDFAVRVPTGARPQEAWGSV